MSSLFYPLLTFALLTLVISYWAITAVYPKENHYKFNCALFFKHRYYPKHLNVGKKRNFRKK